MRIGKSRMKTRRFIILSICAVLLVAGILVTVLRPKRPVLYRVTYLPSLGGEFTLPCSINDNGQIAGFSQDKNRSYHLFLWDRQKGIQDLGLVVRTRVYNNNAGQIAGTMGDPNGNERAFIWVPNRGRCILPTLGGNIATVNGINNRAQVVGNAQTSSGIFHAFVWDDVNGIRDLTTSSTTLTHALSINNAGQVVVYAQNSPLLVDVNEGVISTSPSIPFLGLIDINNNGYIAGVVPTVQGKFDISISYTGVGTVKLLQLNMNSYATPHINDVNQVALTEDRHSKFILFGRQLFLNPNRNFLHDPNLGRISLNRYVSTSRGEIFGLTDINNKGCIIGAVQSTKSSGAIQLPIKGSRSRGVLLEPIPEQWNSRINPVK